MCDESDDDELMDAVLLELQIQSSVGKATGTPMLHRHDLARLLCKFASDLAAPLLDQPAFWIGAMYFQVS